MRLLALILICLTLASRAEAFLNLEGVYSAEANGSRPVNAPGVYVSPNELYPEKAIPLYKQASQGVHLSVGTERGFIGAGLNPNATHLLLVDNNPLAVRFNWMNIGFLQLAKDREDYLHLRYHATYDEIRERLEKAAKGKVHPAANAHLRDIPMFRWWEEKVRPDPRGFADLNWLQGTNKKSSNMAKKRAFEKSSYLHIDEVFDRVHALAQEGKIFAFQQNIADKNFPERLQSLLGPEKLKIGTADISNAWWTEYVGKEGMKNFTQAIDQSGSGRTLLILTHSNHATYGLSADWEYIGVSVGKLKEELTLAAEQKRVFDFSRLFRHYFYSSLGKGNLYVHRFTCRETFARLFEGLFPHTAPRRK